jgi:hypothetical protein
MNKSVSFAVSKDDNPSPTIPYPAGYSHDLSLITDNNLPALVSPPGHPVVHPDCVDVGAGECSSVRRPFRHDWMARWANKSRQVDTDLFM